MPSRWRTPCRCPMCPSAFRRRSCPSMRVWRRNRRCRRRFGSGHIHAMDRHHLHAALQIRQIAHLWYVMSHMVVPGGANITPTQDSTASNSPLSQGNQSSGTTKVAYVKCKTNQIHCAAMSPSTGLIAFIDSRDSVNLVNLRSPGFPVNQLGDISRERQDASPAEKNVTITMLDEGHVYVYFVVNLKPRLIRFSVTGSKDIINTDHLLRDAAVLDSS